MSRLSLAGAACALWFVAAPVAAEPFANFVDLCLETNADRQAAVSAAKAAGWFPMPPEAMDGSDQEFRDLQVYLSADPFAQSDKGPPADLEMLMTGWGSGDEVFGIGGVRVDACVVMSLFDDRSDLAALITERLGFAAINLGDQDGWVFSREGSGFRSEADLMELEESELPRIARERKLYMLGVLNEDGMAGLMLGAVRPD